MDFGPSTSTKSSQFLDVNPSSGRKPLALLQKIKRQASALVRPSPPPTPPFNASSHFPNESPVTTRSPFDRPTVSFAPTPAHTESTRSSSTYSRSSIDDDSSFLDCGDDDRRPSFGIRRGRLRHGKSLPTLNLFRNRNSNFVFNTPGSQNGELLAASRDDVRSLATEETTETATEEAVSLESDFVPYIPLVLQHERGMVSLLSVGSGRSETPSARSRPTTPSNSDGSVDSAHSLGPITPRTPYFAQSSVSVSSEGDETESMRSLAPFVTDASHDADLEGATKKAGALSLKPRTGLAGEFADAPADPFNAPLHSPPPFTSSRRDESPFANGYRFRSQERHPYAQGGSSESDTASPPRAQPQAKAEAYDRKYADEVASLATTSESCYSTESYDQSQTPVTDPFATASTSLSAPNALLEPSGPLQFPSSRTPFDDDDEVENVIQRVTPPDIRVEIASVVSDLPTPTGFTMPKTASLLHPKHSLPDFSRQQLYQQIGVGRRTVDPKEINDRKSVASTKEWTLLLGVGDEEETASQSDDRRRTMSLGGRALTSPPAQLLERQRAKSGLSVRHVGEALDALGPAASSSASGVIQFAPDAHVQKPLLRVQPLFDPAVSGTTSDSDADDHPRVSRSPSKRTVNRNQSLRRSGSAMPVLGRANDLLVEKDDSDDVADPVDWTLMLPLPMPKNRSSVSKLPIPSSSDMGRSGSKRRRHITKARSSIDLTSGMDKDFWSHAQSSKPRSKAFNPSAALNSIKKELENLEETNAKVDKRWKARQETKMQQEELLAAIFDSKRDSGISDGDLGDESEESESGDERNSDKEREKEDNRQRALDQLSGNSSPVSASRRGSMSSAPSSPKKDGSIKSAEAKTEVKESAKSPLREEVDLHACEPVPERPCLAIQTNEDALPSTSSGTRSAGAVYSPTKSLFPFASVISQQQKPSIVPSSFFVNFTRPSSLSLSSRAPIGPSKGITGPGWSFSQYAPLGSKSKAPAPSKLGRRPSTASGVMRDTSGAKQSPFPSLDDAPGAAKPRPVTTVLQALGTIAPADSKDHEATDAGLKQEKEQKPLSQTALAAIDDDDASVYSVDSAISSTSSTDTVVPPTSNSPPQAQRTSVVFPEVAGTTSLGAALEIPERDRRVSTCSSFYDSDAPFDLDFPMPPSHSPSPVFGQPYDVAMASKAGACSPSPPRLRTAPSPVPPEQLGMEEDVELPPPTPISATPVVASGSRVLGGSPRRVQQHVQRSPPRTMLHPMTILDRRASVSGWVDEGEDDGDDEESDGDGDTVYLSMSEDDHVSTEDDCYEDAMSMLSGVFYSARTSVDSH